MLKKILSFSNPFHLGTKLDQLIITNKETGELISRPIEDLSIVILDNQQITFTQHVLQLLAENNVSVVICDTKHHPSSLLMHLDTHHIQAERFRHQIGASEPLRKQLWQQTVKAKIRNQAKVLELAGEKNITLLNLANKVTSGDISNIEGQAARIYWKQLFGKNFFRQREGPPPNPSLNYGYSIVRAAIARALVGSGLLPTLGIHHHNKYNSFALADDIMEPYRPFVDLLIYRQIRSIPDYHNITKERKAEFLQLLSSDCLFRSNRSPIMVAMEYSSASLAKCFEGDIKKIDYPEIPAE